MSIPIKKEPDPAPPFERCCLCRRSTTHWTDLPDRTPGQQVACCPACAAGHQPAQVPTKDAWCASERALEPQPIHMQPPSPWAFRGPR